MRRERERVGFEVGDIERVEGLDASFFGPVEKFGKDALGIPSVVAGLVGFGFGEEVVVEGAVEACFSGVCAVRRVVLWGACFVLRVQRRGG